MGNQQVTLGDNLKDALGLNFHDDKDSKLTADESKVRRIKVCQEILDTEKTYTELLGVLYEDFQLPMTKEHIRKPEQIKEIFSVTETLYGLHKEFLKKLEERLKPALKSKGYYTLIVGDLFQEYSAFMPMYSAYIDSFDRSNKAVQKLVNSKKRESKKPFKELEDKVKSKTKGLGLTDLLILPVQRLPRYLLLLNSLKEVTLKEHKDYKNLTDALEKVQAVCEHINEAKRKAESAEKLIAYQEKLSGKDTILTPSRVIVLDEDIYAIFNKKKSKIKCKFLLCNDGCFFLEHSLVGKGLKISLSFYWPVLIEQQRFPLEEDKECNGIEIKKFGDETRSVLLTLVDQTNARALLQVYQKLVSNNKAAVE